MKKSELKQLIKETILRENLEQIKSKIISLEQAIKEKQNGKFDGADWYYYRGFLVSHGNPSEKGGYTIDNKTWLVPKSFIENNNVKGASYPAFYK